MYLVYWKVWQRFVAIFNDLSTKHHIVCTCVYNTLNPMLHTPYMTTRQDGINK